MSTFKLRTPEAAQFLCLSTNPLAKMRLKGEGPAFSKVGRICIYGVNDLEDGLNKNKQQSISE